MQVQSPSGTIGHIIDDAVVGNILAGTAVAIVAAKFHFCNDMVGSLHVQIIQGIEENKKGVAHIFSGPRHIV